MTIIAFSGASSATRPSSAIAFGVLVPAAGLRRAVLWAALLAKELMGSSNFRKRRRGSNRFQ